MALSSVITFPETSSCWLKTYNRSTSRRLRLDSSASRRTRVESWLAISEVARNAASATQFCGSAIVNVPTGGRKKKLKASMATTEVTMATARPQIVDITKIASNNVSATVV